MAVQISSRYSDADLVEFKNRIDKKLEYAREDYDFVSSQIKDLTENMESEGDWMDSSSSNNDLEMLYTLANRQRKHIDDLEKALLRIRNRTYGVCEVTGELIDKRRLFAVPTTSKSLAAKLGEVAPMEKEEKQKDAKKKSKSSEPVVFTKVIKKPTVKSVVRDIINEDIDGEDLDDEEIDISNLDLEDDMGDFDFDNIADEAFDEEANQD